MLGVVVSLHIFSFWVSLNMSLFVYTGIAYLLLYMDDIILTASSPALLQRIIERLHAEFSMTDLGHLHHFLGICHVFA